MRVTVLNSKSDHITLQHNSAKRFPSFKIKATFLIMICKSLHEMPPMTLWSPLSPPSPSSSHTDPLLCFGQPKNDLVFVFLVYSPLSEDCCYVPYFHSCFFTSFKSLPKCHSCLPKHLLKIGIPSLPQHSLFHFPTLFFFITSVTIWHILFLICLSSVFFPLDYKLNEGGIFFPPLLFCTPSLAPRITSVRIGNPGHT